MDLILAPIILFVYNRPWHTKQVLEALMKNELADQSTLYIYCDGPKPAASVETIKSIKEVSLVIREKNWCKEVKIIESSKNLGLANSVIRGITEVINKHGKVIVLEDDIITGKYFLKFMNIGLETYKEEDRVFGISGYKYPSIRKINNSTYFLPLACSWSYAIWSNRWNKINFNANELLEVINQKGFKTKINFGGYNFYQTLVDQSRGSIDTWDIQFYISMFLEDSFFLFPNNSLVENIGFDHSGIHCGRDNFFSKVKKVNKKIRVDKLSTELNEEIVNSVRKSFELNNLYEPLSKQLKLNNQFIISGLKKLFKKLLGKLIRLKRNCF